MSGEGAYQLGEMVTGCPYPACLARGYCQALLELAANQHIPPGESKRGLRDVTLCPHAHFVRGTTDYMSGVTDEADE